MALGLALQVGQLVFLEQTLLEVLHWEISHSRNCNMKNYLTPLSILAITVALFVFVRMSNIPLIYENIIILFALSIATLSTIYSLVLLLKAKKIGLAYLAPLIFLTATIILHNIETKKGIEIVISKMHEEDLKHSNTLKNKDSDAPAKEQNNQ